jgi:1,4-alpha-glucan branching enzyme
LKVDVLVQLVLHAHLPFVRHPEHVEFLEEEWLFEAISETYVPLLRMMDRLRWDGVPFRLTMTMTPPLCAMLQDPVLMSRYRSRLAKLQDLAQLETQRAQGPFRRVARLYREIYNGARLTLEERCRGDLLSGFIEHMRDGNLEIVTCTATHGILPLLGTERGRLAQVRAGKRSHARVFGVQPRGIWLAECGYAAGVDRLLAREGFEFSYVDSHGILFANPRARYGVFAPVRTPAGPALFGRDLETGRQVWSAKEGYPGDPQYREFYRDLGFDAPFEDVQPFLHPDGARRALGFKYHRITGDVPLHAKEPYDPDRALERAKTHAGNFLFNRGLQGSHLRGLLDRTPVVTAMYDAELFGHWWFEGPWFIEEVFRQGQAIAGLRFVTAREALASADPLQTVEPATSSWGAEGYFAVWLNGQNAWIYRHLHRAEEEMVALADRFAVAEGPLRRTLDQAARELLLAQASDWPFIVTAGTVVTYALRRVREHLDRFWRMKEWLDRDAIDEEKLADWEQRTNIFPEMDWRVFREAGVPDEA